MGVELTVGAVLASWVVLAIAGRGQARQAEGTLARVAWVTGVLALAACAPVAVYAAAPDGVSIALPTGLTVFNVLVLRAQVGRTRTAHGVVDLPHIDDPELTARIRDLAHAQGIEPPPARLLTSAGSMQTIAAVFGLVAPVLLLADGILHRLDREERDAVLAHELAHLATRSTWLFVLVFPAASALTAVAALVLPPPALIPFGLVLLIGLRRIVGRPFEVICDLRAGATVGYAAMSTAVAKIHAVQLAFEGRLVPRLFHGTSTHPSLTLRRAALRDRAPADEAAQIVVDERERTIEQRIAQGALGGWIAVLGASMLLADRGVVAAAPSGAALVLLAGLHMVVARRAQRDIRVLKSGARRRWTVLLPVLAGLGVVVGFGGAGTLLSTGAGGAVAVLLSFAGAAACAGWLVALLWRGVQLQQTRAALAHAFVAGDPRKAVEVSGAVLRSGDPSLRNDLAMAHAALGEFDQAERILRDVITDANGFPLPRVNLGVLQLGRDPADALALARGAAKLVPNAPAPAAVAARALRLLGRTEEAAAVLAPALTTHPRDGGLIAIASWLAADRGDRSQAEALLAQARELLPGHVFLTIGEALLAEDTDEAITRAEEAAAASSMSFVDGELAALRA